MSAHDSLGAVIAEIRKGNTVETKEKDLTLSSELLHMIWSLAFDKIAEIEKADLTKFCRTSELHELVRLSRVELMRRGDWEND